MDTVIDNITNAVKLYGTNVLAATIILVLGLIIIANTLNVTKKVLEKKNIEPTLSKFLINLLNWSLKILLFIMVAAKLGIETTSFAAIIAAAGLAVGMALQGSLSNFAGGVLILVLKPFKVGDFIEAQSSSGTVKEIGIFNTVLTTASNELIIIPNGKLSNDRVINYSSEPTRRDNIVIGIGYDSDLKKAKDILIQLATSNPKVLKDPAPQVVVSELADSSVNLSLRFWTKNEDFWSCHFEILEQIKTEFDANNIEIPYPHQVAIKK